MSRRHMSRRRQNQRNDQEAQRNGHTNDEQSSLLGKSERKARSALHTAGAFLRLNHCNILLPIVPVALTFGFLGMNPIAVFVLNFLAIIPLASLLSDATEELAEHVGHTLGGLLNATFGNTTELIARPLLFLTASETNKASR